MSADLIIECCNAGLSAKQAAAIGRCDVSTAYRFARRARVKFSKEGADAEALYGFALRRAAKEENARMKRVLRGGEANYTPQPPKNIAERLKPLIGTGINKKQAAQRLGCSHTAVTKALKRLGVSL